MMALGYEPKAMPDYEFFQISVASLMALSICSLIVPGLIPRDLAMALPDSPLSTLLRRYSYLGFCLPTSLRIESNVSSFSTSWNPLSSTGVDWNL